MDTRRMYLVVRGFLAAKFDKSMEKYVNSYLELTFDTKKRVVRTFINKKFSEMCDAVEKKLEELQLESPPQDIPIESERGLRRSARIKEKRLANLTVRERNFRLRGIYTVAIWAALMGVKNEDLSEEIELSIARLLRVAPKDVDSVKSLVIDKVEQMCFLLATLEAKATVSKRMRENAQNTA